MRIKKKDKKPRVRTDGRHTRTRADTMVARSSGKKGASSRLVRNADAVSYLMRAPRKMRDSMIKEAPTDLVESLCECVYNVLNGNIPASVSQKKALYKHRNALRRLVGSAGKKKESVTSKKRILTAPQSGGFFLPLIGKLLLPMLAGTLFK